MSWIRAPDGFIFCSSSFADREVSLPVPGNVPCSINCASGGGSACFVQGLASFCNWSCKFLLLINLFTYLLLSPFLFKRFNRPGKKRRVCLAVGFILGTYLA